MIIGLTGPNASGKGEASNYLRAKGFRYYSLSDVLREKARELNLEPSRENLIKLGNELRSKNGPSFLALEIIKRIKHGGDYIIDSIRNPAEITAFRERFNGFKLIGIDAPIEARFKRALKRNRSGDGITLQEFIEKEKKENINCSINQQLENCIKLADKIITNDSTLEEFYKKIDEAIKEI